MRTWPLMLALACGVPDGTDAPVDTDLVSDRTLEEATAPGPHAVGVRTFDWVATDRERQPNGDDPGARTRELTTEVWYPATTGTPERPERMATAATGPFPVVVFSHGFMSTRTDHAGLAAFLATHGYVFAAVDFPLSKRSAPGGSTVLDVDEQALDVGFVLDQLLAEPTLTGVVDPEHIAFAGMSLGGLTTLLAGLHPTLRDDRVDVLVPIAPSTCYLPTTSFDAPSPPTLVVHGEADWIVPFAANAEPLYGALTGDRVLLSLVNGSHTGFPDVTAELFDGAPHPDSIGCSSIGGQVPDSEDGGFEDLLGEGVEVLNPTCGAPCEGQDESVVAMRPTRQVVLLKAGVLAFLDGWIRGDDDARTYLLGGIGTEADASVQAQVAPNGPAE